MTITNTSGITRTELIDNTTEHYRLQVEAIEANPDVNLENYLTDGELNIVLEEVISKRLTRGRFTMLRNPPTFHKKPLGSLYLRLYYWHGSGGNIDGYMMAKWDCGLLMRLAADPTSSLTREHREFCERFETGEQLFDALDTTVIVNRGGKSPAAQAWRRAVGEFTGRFESA